MDQVRITSDGNKYICDECKNECEIPEGTEIDDVLECEFCGIEYRVVEINDDGNYILELLEEEK